MEPRLEEPDWVRAKRGKTTIQTVILSKETFASAAAARKWVKANGLRTAKVDETGSSYRFRQRDPSDFQENSFRTIELTEGVKAVVGHLKKGKRSVQDGAAIGGDGESAESDAPTATSDEATDVRADDAGGDAPAGDEVEGEPAPAPPTEGEPERAAVVPMRFGMPAEELRSRREALERGEPLKLGVQYRDMEMEVRTIDVEERLVELTFSSEVEVERWYGIEILDHGKSAVRLGRLKRGGPLFVNHERDQHVGVVEEVWVGDDRRGHAIVRFGRSSLATEIYNDVLDRIRRNVSFGYRIYRFRREKPPEDGRTMGPHGATEEGAGSAPQPLRLRGTDWEPVEITIASIAEDLTVGIGRSADDGERIVEIEGMETREGSAAGATVVDPPESEEHQMDEKELKELRDKIAQETRTAESERTNSILDLAERVGKPELARDAIQNGMSRVDFQDLVLDAITKDSEKKEETRSQPEGSEEPPAHLGMEDREVESYKLFRALNAYIENDWSKAGLEREASIAVAERRKEKPKGFYVPNDVLADPNFLRGSAPVAEVRQLLMAQMLERTLSIATPGTTGAALRGTELLAGSFIELLRNRAVVMQAGARVLDGLVGNIDIPRQSTGGTAYWVGENAAPSAESAAAFDTVGLNPKTVGAYQGITRKMLLQSTPAAEGLIRDDLLAVTALLIDAGALFGTGVAPQPTGVANQSGIGDVNVAGAPTYADFVEFETDIASQNAPEGSRAYIFSSKVRGYCKTKEKFAATGQTVWEPGGTVNGYPALVSNQCRDDLGGGSNQSECYFGDWREVLVGMWGGMDLKPDEATLASSGGLVLRVFQDVDVAVRHAASFSYSDDFIV